MRRFVHYTLGFGVLIASAPALADCDSSLSEARALARDVSVEIVGGTAQRAGTPLKITWTRRSTTHPQAPVYIVVTAPPEVRFAGNGFIALAAAAPGPYELQFGKSQSRALVAIHRKNDTASHGEFAITPYRSGSQTYAWAVVTAGSCGEQILAQGTRAIEIAPGAAELVVQDRFTTDQPKQRIRSNDGNFDLLVFDGRFEVHDVGTDSTIVKSAGVDANFSPTGRFVAWRHQGDDLISLADLVSGTIVANDLVHGFLAWARADSYVVAGGGEWGAVRVRNTLVDGGNVLTANAGPHAADAWTSVQVTLDVNRGFALVTGDFGWKIGDLFARTASKDDEVKTETADALNQIRDDYDAGYAALPKIWSLGERLKLSHGNFLERTQAPFLVRHKPQPTPSAAASVTTATQLVGRNVAASRDVGPDLTGAAATSNLAFDSLASFAVNTLAPAPLKRVLGGDNLAGAMANRKLSDREILARVTQDNERRKRVIDEMMARVPEARSIFVKTLEAADCELGPKFQISPDFVSDVWRWQTPGGDRWIVQTATFMGGSAAAPHDCVILLREKSSDAVTILTSKLGINTDGGGLDATINVYRLSASLIAVTFDVSEQTNGIGLFDTDTAAMVGLKMPLVAGSVLSDLRLTADSKHLVQLNKDGRFFVNRIADAKRVMQGSYVDNEIVLMTEDGRYDTSYEGAAAVQLRFAGIAGLFSVNQYEALLRRANLAKDVLDGRDVAPRAAALATPPTAQLTLSSQPVNGRRIGKVVANSSRGLSAIRIHVDGRIVSEIAAKGQRAEIPIDLPDPGGARWISAIAVDAQGLVSLPSAIQLPGAPRPRGVARVIAVGVDAYSDPKIPTLQSAKLDAGHFVTAVANTANRTFATVQSSLLLDSNVTPESVLDAVRAAVNQTGPDDTLVFFFAGHGVDGARLNQPSVGLVLTTNRTQVSDLASTSVRWTALAEVLGGSKGTVVVVLDACQSGMAGREAFSTNDDVVSALFTKSGAPLIVLAASKGRQLSQEAPNGGGGRFTNAIVAAISADRAKYDRDRSGLIDLRELYSGVKARVMADTKGEQTPWLARNGLVGEMSLF